MKSLRVLKTTVLPLGDIMPVPTGTNRMIRRIESKLTLFDFQANQARLR